MNKTGLTEDRICTVLREKLYSMANNESRMEYEPLQLKWVLPIESTEGMILLFENIIFLLDYVQKNACNRDTIDQIIENDIRPIVNGFSNEYDFFIAATIIIVCSMTDDFSDLDALMKLVKEIIGQFIGLLETALEQFDSENYNQNADKSTYEIDTSGLELGMVVKNYKEMCRILGEEITDGNSKKAQLKEWARYFFLSLIPL